MKKLIGEEAILLTFNQSRHIEPQVKTYKCIIEDVLEHEYTPYAFVFRLKPKDEEQEKELEKELDSKLGLSFIAAFDDGKILFSTKYFTDGYGERRIAFVILPTVKGHLIQKESKTMATSSSSSSSSSKTAPKSACEKVTETGREVAKIAFGNTILEKGSSEIIKRLPPIIRGYAEDYKPIFELALSMVLSKGVEMYMHDNEKAEVIMECVEKAAIARSATMISNVAMKFLSGIEIPDALKK